MLRGRGHEVEVMEQNNDEIVRWTSAAKAAFECIYSFSSARDLRQVIDRFRPDIAHVHNFFPRVSPSAHYALHEVGVPVVQTIHNYRLLCPGATFLRNGKVCEECLGMTIPWPAAIHGCYRDSKAASAALANMLSIHRALGTWKRTVSCFIAPTEFARGKFIQGGFPAEKIQVKSHFVNPDPGIGAGDGNFALFVGRLAEGKGLATLLGAWQLLGARMPLKIVGDGPLADSVKEAAATIPGVEWLGSHRKEAVQQLMRDAAFLVVPSESYETFGMVVAEAFAAGLPVIASRLGAMEELVSDGETGWLFQACSRSELAEKVEWALSHPGDLRAMRQRSRLEYERNYTPEANYSMLMRIYESACESNCNIVPVQS